MTLTLCLLHPLAGAVGVKLSDLKPKSSVDLKPLKEFVKSRYPKRHILRVMVLKLPDSMSPTAWKVQKELLIKIAVKNRINQTDLLLH